MWTLVILFVSLNTKSVTSVDGFVSYQSCMVEAAKVKHWEYSAKTLCVEVR